MHYDGIHQPVLLASRTATVCQLNWAQRIRGHFDIFRYLCRPHASVITQICRGESISVQQSTLSTDYKVRWICVKRVRKDHLMMYHQKKRHQKLIVIVIV